MLFGSLLFVFSFFKISKIKIYKAIIMSLQIFLKYRTHLKFLGARMVTRSKFCTEDAHS